MQSLSRIYQLTEMQKKILAKARMWVGMRPEWMCITHILLEHTDIHAVLRAMKKKHLDQIVDVLDPKLFPMSRLVERHNAIALLLSRVRLGDISGRHRTPLSQSDMSAVQFFLESYPTWDLIYEEYGVKEMLISSCPACAQRVSNLTAGWRNREGTLH